jgi:hypothetical protein
MIMSCQSADAFIKSFKQQVEHVSAAAVNIIMQQIFSKNTRDNLGVAPHVYMRVFIA